MSVIWSGRLSGWKPDDMLASKDIGQSFLLLPPTHNDLALNQAPYIISMVPEQKFDYFQGASEMARRHNPDSAAELSEITTWERAGPYLDNLCKTIQDDVGPLIKTEGRAPFAICREVLSYIDHLGHLYSGKGERGQVSDRINVYLKCLMSRIDENYGERAEHICNMYRNGPVHEFKPKVLENDSGQLLVWYCYSGERSGSTHDFGPCLAVTHLVPVNPSRDNKLYYLPVSTNCLIDDLCTSIKEFKTPSSEVLKNPTYVDERITAWNRAARVLGTPRPCKFVVP